MMGIIRKKSAECQVTSWKNSHRIGTMRSIKTFDKRPLTAQIGAYTRPTKGTRVRGSESPLYASTCPVIYIFRVFGLMPYEFDEDELVPSNNNTIFSIVWLCIYSYCIYDVFMRFTYVDPNSPVLHFTELAKVFSDPSIDTKAVLYGAQKYVQVIFNYIVVIIDLVFVMSTRSRIARIWNQIQDYDEVIRDLGYARNERNSAVWVWAMLLFWGVVYTLINQIGMYAFNETWLKNMTYMILYVGTCLSVLKFSSIVLMLADRFTDLTTIAEKNAPLAQKWTILVAPVDVQVVEHLHDDLMVICESLSDLYSWPLMFTLCNLCLHIVSGLYDLIAQIINDNELIYRWDFVCLIMWSMSLLSQLFILHCSCHLVSLKANRMGYIILGWKRWLYLCRDSKMDLKPSVQFVNRSLGIDAGGCFDVNLPLLRSIIGMQTTYLVLLLQIG